MDNTPGFCLESLLREDRIACFFQPLVAARQRRVIGYEALCRGVTAEGALVPPAALFAAAERDGLRLALDRRCREQAALSFASLHRENRELLLFLNLDVTVIREGVVGSGHLLQAVTAVGIPPGNVVIEIIEAGIDDQAAFAAFLDTYRGYGFLVGLDDIGSGYSNLDRISLIKPDIIKLDRSLLSDVDREYHKQAVVRALVGLSRRIGALVVAEGVEREEEVLAVMEMGADFLQGFFFSRPLPAAEAAAAGGELRLAGLALRFRRHFLERMELKRRVYQGFRDLLDWKAAELAIRHPDGFAVCLEEVFAGTRRVECLYVLDGQGMQLTPTVMRDGGAAPGQRGGVFRPAAAGTDQSLKEYYLVLQGVGENDRFTSEPYISLATGSICVTFSRRFRGSDGGSLILCIDVNVEGLFLASGSAQLP